MSMDLSNSPITFDQEVEPNPPDIRFDPALSEVDPDIDCIIRRENNDDDRSPSEHPCASPSLEPPATVDVSWLFNS